MNQCHFLSDAQQVVVTRNVENDQKALFLIDVSSGESRRITDNFLLIFMALIGIHIKINWLLQLWKQESVMGTFTT